MRHFKFNFKFILMSVVATLLFAACGTTSTVPITGRKHNLIVTDAQVLSLSNQQYSEFMKTAKLSTNAANTAMVKRVGTRLANAGDLSEEQRHGFGDTELLVGVQPCTEQ